MSPPGPLKLCTSSTTEKLVVSIGREKLIVVFVSGSPLTAPGPLLVTNGLNSVGGRSNASLKLVDPEPVVFALHPKPRRANASHNSRWFCPPVSATSAARTPSRACTNVGLAGEFFIPSITRRIASVLPLPACVPPKPCVTSGLKPCLSIRFQLMSHSVLAQSSPVL